MLKRPTDESMICGIFGDRGAGKTLTAVGFARQYAMQGWPVYTNLRLSFESTMLDFADFLLNPRSYENCVILFDELHNYASARTSMSAMNKLLSRFILQVRHLNDVLIYTSMRSRLVDWVWTDQTDLLCYCRWIGAKGFPSPADAVSLTVLDQTKDPSITTVWQYRASQFYDMYDTKEKMDITASEYFSDLLKALRKSDQERFKAKLEELKKTRNVNVC